MTEKSIFWTTSGTGDGTADYTQAELIRWMRQTFLSDPTIEAVLHNYANELEVTGTSSPVQVDTGGAIVYGFPYWNTAAVNVPVPTPSSNARLDLIVLEADWTAQTVRITRVEGTEGGAAPTPTQLDGSIWQVILATLAVSTGGTIDVYDGREFCNPNIEVTTEMIKDAAVRTAKIANLEVTTGKLANLSVTSGKIANGAVGTTQLANDSVDDAKAGNRVPQFYRRQGGDSSAWGTAGTSNYTPTAVRMQAGVVQETFFASSVASGSISFPVAFSDVPIVVASMGRDTGATEVPVISIESVTASGFSYRLETKDDTSITQSFLVRWLAVGPE